MIEDEQCRGFELLTESVMSKVRSNDSPIDFVNRNRGMSMKTKRRSKILTIEDEGEKAREPEQSSLLRNNVSQDFSFLLNKAFTQAKGTSSA